MKKGIPFFWDELVDKAFDALNHALTNAPLLHPPDYHRYYFLYLVASYATIGMVLVQEDDSRSEHVVHYLSRSPTKTRIKYTHVEKLALVAMQVFQQFCHYILIQKMTVILDCNPMMYILMKQFLGGNTQSG